MCAAIPAERWAGCAEAKCRKAETQMESSAAALTGIFLSDGPIMYAPDSGKMAEIRGESLVFREKSGIEIEKLKFVCAASLFLRTRREQGRRLDHGERRPLSPTKTKGQSDARGHPIRTGLRNNLSSGRCPRPALSRWAGRSCYVTDTPPRIRYESTGRGPAG